MLIYNRLYFPLLLLFVGCQLDEPAKPIAKFSAAGDNCVGPCTVTFTNTSENTSIYNWTYSWNFGDGTSSIEKNPSHLYKTGGSFKVVLTLSGKYGTAMDSATVIIKEKQADPPIPDFVIETKNLIVDSAITFTNISKNAVSYLWNFGDKSADSTSTEANPEHTYKTKGSYTLRLEATGPGGKEMKDTVITIKALSASADFNMTESITDPSFIEISFENKSSHATKYEWDFGDKSKVTDKTPKHKYTRYNADSTYTVTLKAFGADTAVKTKPIKIKKK